MYLFFGGGRLYKRVIRPTVGYYALFYLYKTLTPEELARRRKNFATQFGQGKDTADLALDGDTNPHYEQGHCAIPSGRGSVAWWMVDLGKDYAIYNVTIYGPSHGK